MKGSRRESVVAVRSRARATRTRAAGRLAIVASAALAAGCASHPREPLESGAVLEALLSRTPATLEAQVRDVAPDSAFALEDGLDVHEAQVLVLFTGPRARLARSAAGVEVAGRVAAGAWEDPVLGIDGAAVLSPENLLEYGVGFALTVPIFGSNRSARNAADATARAALAEAEAAEWNARLALRADWARWSALERRVRDEEALAAAIGELAGRVEAWRAGGALSTFEARLVQTRHTSQRIALAALRDQVEEARLGLFAELGLHHTSGIELIPSGAASHESLPTAVALELLAAHNLDLVAAHARYDAAEAALALEVRRQYPDLGLGLGAGSEGEDDRVLFGLELPLPLWNRNARAIAVALAQRAFERTRYETELARVAIEYADARRRLEGAATRRAVVIEELLPLIELQAQDLALLRESGRLDVSALLEALSARADALDTAVAVEVEFARAAADVERLVGPPQHVQSHVER